jgi:DNA recombination protein Rad52
MTCTFSPEQIAFLSAPLDRAKVRQREQGRNKVSYLEGWQVIAEANRIFGFDGWQRETIAVECVNQSERSIGRDGRSGWGVTYTARVRITVGATDAGPVIREGSGAGHGIDIDLGQAHESALKEAETDAMKRALMTFGNPFGLALYDRLQRGVTSSPGGEEQVRPGHRDLAPAHSPATGHGQRRPSQPQRGPVVEPRNAESDDPALAPLDSATIHQLHSTIRSLPRPALEGFTKAFRKRFQVPPDAPSIADRICQRCHHDWIETFLVQHQPSRVQLVPAEAA